MSQVRILQRSEADRLRAEETAVVVDVLRATSTVAIALAQGATSVHPVLTPADARARAEDLAGDPVLIGERARGELDGFVDNSPARVAELDLTGQEVVMTTTNGTKALLACGEAGRVVAAGLVNAGRLVEALRDQPVALVASGWMGEPTSDDDACCAYLAKRLRGEQASLDDHLGTLEASTSARMLRKHGKGADVDLCFTLDATDVLPVMDDQGALVPR